MLEIQDLVGRLGDVIGAFSARVWTHITALQHARGLVATPYIMCGVTVGAHLSTPKHPPLYCLCVCVRCRHHAPHSCNNVATRPCAAQILTLSPSCRRQNRLTVTRHPCSIFLAGQKDYQGVSQRGRPRSDYAVFTLCQYARSLSQLQWRRATVSSRSAMPAH